MLSTHFGKFRLKFIASINIAALLSLFNIASTTSGYWIKYIDNLSGNTHYAGMWISCPNQGDCEWKNGIVNHEHSTWSVMVRFLITLGTICNAAVVAIFCLALLFKLKKNAMWAIRVLEIGNFSMVGSLLCLLIGFCIFISSTCNYSLWLFVLSMVILVVTCNLLTRTLSAHYFQHFAPRCSETGHTKLPNENEEAVALTKEASVEKTDIEMDKIPEPVATEEAQVTITVTPSEEPKAEEAVVSSA